jgi:hypothetical protein
MIGDFPGIFVLHDLLVSGTKTITTLRSIKQTTFVTLPTFTLTPQTITIPNFANAIPMKPIVFTEPGVVPTTIQVPVITKAGSFTQTTLVTVPGVGVVPVQMTIQTTMANGTLQTQISGLFPTATTVRVPVTTTTMVPVQRQVPTLTVVSERVAFPFGGPFKVSENESPSPQDRVFFTYNFYDGLIDPGQGTPPAGNTPGPRLNVHREVIGFEKSFLDGHVSFGLRAPAGIEVDGADGLAEDNFGDLTMLLKYAPYNNRDTGDCISTGLAITLPTGPGIPTVTGNLHPTILQPFVGGIYNLGHLYVHGFTSLAVPTDSQDVTLLFNDLGVGYSVYRSNSEKPLISAIVPTVECHVTTPLNHRGTTDPIVVPDLVVLTAGAHVDLFRAARLTVGLATPVTGPRLFDVEAVAQFNCRF